MAEINLIPTELAPKGLSVRLAQILRNVATAGFVLVVVAGVGLGSFFLLTSLEIKNSNTRQDQLKTQIKSLESTEQSLVLLKDRISKAKQVMGADTISPVIVKTDAIISVLPPSVQAKEIDIADLTKFTVTVSDTSQLTQFMSALMAANKFLHVDLKGFSFSPASGYLVSLEFTDK